MKLNTLKKLATNIKQGNTNLTVSQIKSALSVLTTLELIIYNNSTNPEKIVFETDLTTASQSNLSQNPVWKKLMQKINVMPAQVDNDNPFDISALNTLKHQYQDELMATLDENTDILQSMTKVNDTTYQIESNEVFKPFNAYRAVNHLITLHQSNVYFDTGDIKSLNFKKYPQAVSYEQLYNKLQNVDITLTDFKN